MGVDGLDESKLACLHPRVLGSEKVSQRAAAGTGQTVQIEAAQFAGRGGVASLEGFEDRETATRKLPGYAPAKGARAGERTGLEASNSRDERLPGAAGGSPPGG